jgi:hypothetical protein
MKKPNIKEGQTTQWSKGQTIIYKTLHRKLKIEQHEFRKNLGVNSDVPEGQAVPAPLVEPVMLLLLHAF